MKKITYANDYTVIGNIIDENELTYIVEFEASKGFMDTVTFEKELTVVEEIKEDNLTTIEDVRQGRTYKGILVKGKKYDYLVFKSQYSDLRIEVKKIADRGDGTKTSVMYWEINKETLKGSGGLSNKVMEVVKSLI